MAAGLKTKKGDRRLPAGTITASGRRLGAKPKLLVTLAA